MSHTTVDPSLDPAVVDRLFGRSLLLTRDWSAAEIDALLAVAKSFETADRAGRSVAFLPDELAYALFFDNSTRTKSAWAGAAARLGMRPVIVDGSSTQVEHGETAEETGAMLGMNGDSPMASMDASATSVNPKAAKEKAQREPVAAKKKPSSRGPRM